MCDWNLIRISKMDWQYTHYCITDRILLWMSFGNFIYPLHRSESNNHSINNTHINREDKLYCYTISTHICMLRGGCLACIFHLVIHNILICRLSIGCFDSKFGSSQGCIISECNTWESSLNYIVKDNYFGRVHKNLQKSKLSNWVHYMHNSKKWLKLGWERISIKHIY